MRSEIDVLCIGNAIVDVLCRVDDAAIERLNLNRGTMTLIDAARADELYQKMGPAMEASGGSAANTAAGVASCGGRVGFIGKVKNDDFGAIFAHDLRSVGVAFDTTMAKDGPPTARSYIFITPDAHRTMNTYLGACVRLAPADIDEAVVARASVTYLEGYLWDPPLAKEAFRKAALAAHVAGRKVALTLSDPFCVQRHRASFLELLRGHVDILFANESELLALYETTIIDVALKLVERDCPTVAVTMSEHGSVVLGGGAVHRVPAEKVAKVVDTTGAGDLYAAGFLWALTQGRTMPECGRAGAIAAAEVIQHLGPRPQTSLKALVA